MVIRFSELLLKRLSLSNSSPSYARMNTVVIHSDHGPARTDRIEDDHLIAYTAATFTSERCAFAGDA